MKLPQDKEKLITQLKKTPVVQVACEKTNISRATYYRWRESDAAFRDQTDAAIHEGNMLMNDMAISRLLSAINDQNISAIKYWLTHNHPQYANTLHVTTTQQTDALTPEQERIVSEALEKAQLLTSTNKPNEKKHTER